MLAAVPRWRHHTHGLQAATEAVDIRRRLAAANPAAFEPDLAGSLNNLGAMLSDLGRREEALTATTEAVDRYARLAPQAPARFTEALHTAVTSLASQLDHLGRTDDAARARSRINNL